MKEKLSLLQCSYVLKFCIVLTINILYLNIQAQNEISHFQDSIPPFSVDTLALPGSTPEEDSASLSRIESDSTGRKRISKNAIEKIVSYESVDSIRIDIRNRKAYLFNKAVTHYEDMELDADYMEIDFQHNELYASGIADEGGAVHGHPVFKQGGGVYRAREIKYNFTTKKGKINVVITSEADGFVHGEQVKKLEDYSFIKKGKYTTCELDHPHFEIAFTKAKVIPNDKIVTGPAYLSFAGVPTFLAIPFGFFPNEKGRSSGLVMPTFRETANRGFAFEGIGFYFGISDNIDLLIKGDIFTRGSWAIKAESNYVFRYKSRGRLELSFAQNLLGERFTPSFQRSDDFKIYWNHQQDPKSHPTTRFSAHINFVTRSYNRYNTTNANDYLSNQYSSKVNFSTNAKGIFFFDASLSYDQNTQTGIINLRLPDISMSVNQFHPFRNKKKTGSLKWYDKISLKWSSQFSNQIDSYDSLLLKPQTWEQMKLGMRNEIPLSIPIKIGRLFNWTTNVNFIERFYFQSVEKEFIPVTDTTGVVNTVFKRGFHALHDLNLNTGISTKVYFMYQYKKGALKAIRHVMTPELKFTYRPNINSGLDGTYYNSITQKEVEYDYFESPIYGLPSTNNQALMTLSIDNNVEMKVRSRRDTVTGTRKIAIFDALNVSMYYDFAADSLRWSPLTIRGRTTLFRQIQISFSLLFDPYMIGKDGTRINEINKHLFRFSSSSVTIGLNWTLDQNFFRGKKSESRNKGGTTESVIDYNALGTPNRRPDFTNPWSLTFNYTFSHNALDNKYFYTQQARNKYTQEIIQTLNVSGDLSLTKKWKIGFSSGYDFKQKKLTYTTIDIYRDLHCWEMRFQWIPIGFHKGWSFTINVKAPVLQDLKYNLKRDFRDYL